MQLSIAEIVPRFPAFRVAVVVAEGLTLSGARPPALDAVIEEREAACRRRWQGMELSTIPGIAAWREAYKGFGIRKTSYRSAVERLVKRVLAGERLPVVNTLVDLYNAVSLAHVFCCGADDLDKVAPPLAFRFSRPGDSFVDMGAEAAEDPPKEGEVVYADSRHVLCRRWNWRQDARTGIEPRTTRAVVTMQANGWGDLDAAVGDLVALVIAHAGGRCRVTVADAAKPTVSL
ncbi:phenylalanine--tRNA ligase beta subunit-related protein [Chelatococcus sp. SYSU_G07232]|uniref:Phenylalanine--tRNA ligase beta subunit-related protein n=1 Tax=Chelatococcus albus TaxID=3047466 RepID=A0ABT7AHS5_9HYPH|nr:phenylalanine--tRNA ligase beta subunit-related protein [Chelatococcus sp. SYSU_G07232]MDJ1158635.1 phenylalanine--tRNA ligase beta subunit-related protein [Chelatococcus sp. SYSU_G07232]